jgi:hypothetical protein
MELEALEGGIGTNLKQAVSAALLSISITTNLQIRW